ncbi:hypothetical protein GPX89_34200 [Nocardia sp. ET3-3]|uniref:ESX-1 secretion-associated protein n=1 Tax=Nocardia terrae TaxID=2675851 RepID=A0A7K1V6W1_9NOCA|nr:hypothetical protein [Nocardia terrae]MVU82277.1 hypothetical protein [Nocardia terrae]
MFQADIDELKKLATTVTSVGDEIDNLDVRTTGDKVGDALPGIPIGAACSQAGEYTEGAWLRIAERMRTLAGIVNQCADDIKVTDTEFKNRLEQMHFFRTGDTA